MRPHALECKGAALITVGAGLPYIRGNARSLNHDLYISFAHTDGMYVFDWAYVFKQGPYVTNNPVPYWTWWWPGAWTHVWAAFRKAHKIEKYLVKTYSPANVAMLYSERTASLYDYRATPISMGGHYCRQQMGLYCLFLQAHLQIDPVYAERLTLEKLERYSVLFIQNAEALTPREEQLVRTWVKNGGSLFVTASTSLRDKWGRKQKDYRLSDVFGVKYVKTLQAGKDRGGAIAYASCVTRKVVKTLQAGKDASFHADPEVAYFKNRHYDLVRPTTGKVVARWRDQAPAVVSNTFGRGNSTYVSARDLGLCFTGRSRPGISDRISVHKTYAPGLRAFIEKYVHSALEAAGKKTIFHVSNCPNEVEVIIRVQKISREKQRRIVHLHNYSFDKPVSRVALVLPAPPGQQLRVFYPFDGQAVLFQRKRAEISFTVRDFDVHEVIVVEPTK